MVVKGPDSFHEPTSLLMFRSVSPLCYWIILQVFDRFDDPFFLCAVLRRKAPAVKKRKRLANLVSMLQK